MKAIFSNIHSPEEGIDNYPVWRRKLLVILLPIAAYLIAAQVGKSAKYWEARDERDVAPECLPPAVEGGWTEGELFGTDNITEPSTGWCCDIVNFPRVDDTFTTMDDMGPSSVKGACLLDQANRIVTNLSDSKYFFDVWLDFFKILAPSLQLVFYVLAVLPCFSLSTSQRFVRLGWSMKIVIPIVVCFIPWAKIYPERDPIEAYAAPLQGILRVGANIPLEILGDNLNATIDEIITETGIDPRSNLYTAEAMPEKLTVVNAVPVLLSQYNNILSQLTGAYNIGNRTVRTGTCVFTYSSRGWTFIY
jgi:hypothetical protein